MYHNSIFIDPSTAGKTFEQEERAALTSKRMPLRLGATLMLILASFAIPSVARAQTGAMEVGIDEKLGDLISLDLTVVNHGGDTIRLADFVDRPTVLALVYYRCPDICSPLLMGLSDAISKMSLESGEDYKILTVSFNPDEGPEDAHHSMMHLQGMYHGEWPGDSWAFTTADSATAAALTDAVGFRYAKVGADQYNHAGALTVLSAEGQVARYLYGITFLPFDLKMALVEAAAGKVGPTINRVLLYCFSYDSEGQTYVFNFLRVVGSVIMFFAVILVAWLVISSRRSHKLQEAT
jgi:protein SCO1/2